MPEQDPDRLETDIEQARERLAATVDLLAVKYTPGNLFARKKASVTDAVKADLQLLRTGRQVVVDENGVEVVREVRRERIAAAAGGVAVLVLVAVVWRRRRRRRSAWERLVDAAQERAELARSKAREAGVEARKSAEEARRLAAAR